MQANSKLLDMACAFLCVRCLSLILATHHIYLLYYTIFLSLFLKFRISPLSIYEFFKIQIRHFHFNFLKIFLKQYLFLGKHLQSLLWLYFMNLIMFTHVYPFLDLVICTACFWVLILGPQFDSWICSINIITRIIKWRLCHHWLIISRLRISKWFSVALQV